MASPSVTDDFLSLDDPLSRFPAYACRQARHNDRPLVELISGMAFDKDFIIVTTSNVAERGALDIGRQLLALWG